MNPIAFDISLSLGVLVEIPAISPLVIPEAPRERRCPGPMNIGRSKAWLERLSFPAGAVFMGPGLGPAAEPG
jgi:hypothetical protein